jgi:hypothetical protein
MERHFFSELSHLSGLHATLNFAIPGWMIVANNLKLEGLLQPSGFERGG